jgi:hypothetical protein
VQCHLLLHKLLFLSLSSKLRIFAALWPPAIPHCTWAFAAGVRWWDFNPRILFSSRMKLQTWICICNWRVRERSCHFPSRGHSVNAETAETALGLYNRRLVGNMQSPVPGPQHSLFCATPLCSLHRNAKKDGIAVISPKIKPY